MATEICTRVQGGPRSKPLDCPPASWCDLAPSQDPFGEIAQLAGRKAVALDVCGQLSLSIDRHGVQRMIQQPLVWKGRHTEHAADPLDVGLRAGQEMPERRVRVPLC